MERKTRLGIIDWGIGGVSINKLIKSQLGSVPVIYFSDTGVTPYGRMSRDELIGRVNTVVAFLQTHGVTHLVVGCNAASTVIPFLRVDKLKVEGIIDSAVSMTVRARPTTLALLGGRRTVLSGVYRRAFEKRGLNVTQRIAQPLSGLIESGDISSRELREHCRKILYPIRNASHILLACTHYPAIHSVLREFVAGETVFLDPADELVDRIIRWNLQVGGRDTFFTTGNTAKMKSAAWKVFGVRITAVNKITL